jgi:hypothetical protein
MTSRALWLAACAILVGCTHWVPVSRAEVDARARRGDAPGTARFQRMVRIQRHEGRRLGFHPPAYVAVHDGQLWARGADEPPLSVPLGNVVSLDEKRPNTEANTTIAVVVLIGGVLTITGLAAFGTAMASAW